MIDQLSPLTTYPNIYRHAFQLIRRFKIVISWPEKKPWSNKNPCRPWQVGFGLETKDVNEAIEARDAARTIYELLIDTLVVLDREKQPDEDDAEFQCRDAFTRLKQWRIAVEWGDVPASHYAVSCNSDADTDAENGESIKAAMAAVTDAIKNA